MNKYSIIFTVLLLELVWFSILCFIHAYNLGYDKGFKSAKMEAIQIHEIDDFVEDSLFRHFPKEYLAIRGTASRNCLTEEQVTLLFAIRKAENGPPGLEFGVMSEYAKNTDLDRQAGACAFEIKRHVPIVTEEAILKFADRYCPPSVDPEGNKNWKHNVVFWYNKLKTGVINNE